MREKPLIIYHRGRHGKHIGIRPNTWDAIARAVEEKAAMIECDVGRDLRVAHDPGEHPLAPRLPDILRMIGGRCAVNIDIKSAGALSEICASVSVAMRFDNFRADQFVLSSFDHETAIRAKCLCPELCVGIIADARLHPAYLTYLAHHGIRNLHLHWTNVCMDIEQGSRMREGARKLNMEIWVWTVNNRAQYHAMKEYGASAIFTDYPHLFREKKKAPKR